MARILIAVLCLFTFACADAADLLWPLEGHEHLTGGYCDSRIDHFHGGVDIRTSGANLPVRAPLDGWVERVAVTPTGYGKVLYLRLANGMTAVFGHLDRFQTDVQQAVRDSQLVAGTYRVDFSFEADASPFHFARGETVAFTGQSGRGAPHLHYELREEAVQTDPLVHYVRRDQQPPAIVDLRWLKLSEFDLQATGRGLELRKEKSGYRGNAIASDEPIAFLISCYDASGWNRAAVPSEVRIRRRNEIVYRDALTRVDLLGARDIYGKLVWSERSRADKDLRRLFQPPAITTVATTLDGWITEADHESISIEIVDRAGNATAIEIPVSVTAQNIAQEIRLPDRIESGAFSLHGEPVALSWATLSGTRAREISVNAGGDGFFDRLTLTYRLADGEDRDGSYWYKRSSSGGRSPLWTVPGEEPGVMSCYLQRGGTYGIARDTSPPILLLSKRGGGFSFTLRDPETGIDDSTVRCTVDGATAIPEYEYEENGGAIWTASPLRSGEHVILFTAANRAGVSKTWDVTMTLP